MTTLLAGPWLGEFAYEKCVWAPLVRRYAHEKKFDRVVIICRPGHEYFYHDFAHHIHTYSKDGRPDRWLLHGQYVQGKVKMPKRFIKKYPDAEVRRPRRKKCVKWPREYVKYGKGNSGDAYDLVIHARSETRNKSGKRNWPVARYSKMLKVLRLKRDLKVACIGSKDGAYKVPGTQDLRGIPLERLCNLLASSRAVVGTSSGPMHLASLCGCPHVVLTGDEWQTAIKGTNKHRYKSLWNPFGTKCSVVDKWGWKPPVEKVIEAVGRLL